MKKSKPRWKLVGHATAIQAIESGRIVDNFDGAPLIYGSGTVPALNSKHFRAVLVKYTLEFAGKGISVNPITLKKQ